MNKYKFLNKKIIIDIIIFIVLTIFAGILSLNLGMDRNTDVKNYHMYNPWAFLNNRVGIDLLPADIQSYFNPLPDVPYFLMIQHFNDYPALVTFIWGFSYALFLFMIYKITTFLFKDYYKLGITIVSVLVASGTIMVVRCIGYVSPDILIADFALISLYLILKSFGKDYHPELIFIAGLIAGGATGLKYTGAIFAIPLVLTFLIFYKQFTKPLESFLLLLFGIITGFLITDGFWMYKLYKEFHNPLFPYFNWIFHSDYINMANVFSTDFAQGIGIIQKKTFLFYPFHYNFDPYFRIFYSLLFINIFTIPFVNKEKFKNIFKINLNYTDFIFIFSLISYIVLAKTYAVIRYYAPIYGMVGIAAIIVLLKFFYILHCFLQYIKEKTKLSTVLDVKKYDLIYVMFALICLTIAFIPSYEAKSKPFARIPVGEKLIDVRDAKIPDNSLILVHDAAIAIPFQNPHATYIGLNSWRFTKMNQVLLSDKYIQKIKNKLKKTPKRIYILTTKKEPEKDEYIKTELDRLGVKTNIKKRKTITTNFLNRYYLIKLEIK